MVVGILAEQNCIMRWRNVKEVLNKLGYQMTARTFNKTSAYNRAKITQQFKGLDINSSLNKL